MMLAKGARPARIAGTAAPAVLLLLGTSAFAGGGAIAGKAALEGPAPAPLMIKMDADKKCHETHGGAPVASEEVLAGEGGALKNVFVYVKDAPKSAAVPETAAVLDQKGCAYAPRVQGVVKGQKLNILNSDPTLHNIRCIAKKNRSFNIAQPKQGDSREKSFDKPEEPVKFKCDVHAWMTAYVFVLEHPYFAVTGADGTFSIPEGLPPGEYTLTAWHEKYGKQEKKITVTEGAAAAGNEFKFQQP